MKNKKYKSSLASLFALIAINLPLINQVESAPYPKEGLQTKWTQPDGTVLQLRVFGDEFYARTETEDGRTVVFNEADQTYHFAKVSADGQSLESNGIPVGVEANSIDLDENVQRAGRKVCDWIRKWLRESGTNVASLCFLMKIRFGRKK